MTARKTSKGAATAASRPDNVRVRLPYGLKTVLTEMADEQGVPINTLITVLLSESVGWKLTQSIQRMEKEEADLIAQMPEVTEGGVVWSKLPRSALTPKRKRGKS